MKVEANYSRLENKLYCLQMIPFITQTLKRNVHTIYFLETVLKQLFCGIIVIHYESLSIF